MKQTATSSVDWPGIAKCVVFVPDEYANPVVKPQQAMDMLRCNRHDLDALVTAGLPYRPVDGTPYFDPNDLYNLGTYSGSGETQPELAFNILFRFMSASPDELTSPREWYFRTKANCSRCANEPSGAKWDVGIPNPHRFGGSCIKTEVSTGPADYAFATTVCNGGVVTPIASTTIRSIATEILSSGLRWQMLPPAMQNDFVKVHASGVTNCISASLALADCLVSAGYDAVARRGWFCGVLGGIMDLPHAWVEVVDDDHITKAVDVATALLASKVQGSECFQKLCFGTPINRVIPSTKSADQLLAQHSCSAGDESITVITDIRKQKSANIGKRRSRAP